MSSDQALSVEKPALPLERYVVYQTKSDHDVGVYNAHTMPRSFHDGHVELIISEDTGTQPGSIKWKSVEATSSEEAIEKAIAEGYQGYQNSPGPDNWLVKGLKAFFRLIPMPREKS